MLTVGQMCKKCRVSARTLRYYDSIGLLTPAGKTDSGYRLYDENAVKQMGTILLFKRRGFPLSDIKDIISAENFDFSRALDRQIEMLKLKRRHIDRLIENAIAMKEKGAENMDFSHFENKELEEYARQAKRRWGDTDAYREYRERAKGRSWQDLENDGRGMMEIFKKFGQINDIQPDSQQAQGLVKELQEYITRHFYTCTKQILAGLGQMYTQDERIKSNIDNAAGRGTAEFAARAIEYYTKG